jgi:hypothetical protein
MRAPSPSPSSFLAREERQDRIGLALVLLLDAWEAAFDLGLPAEDFAVEVREFQSLGLTATDLRWLVARGYADHLREDETDDRAGRSFLAPPGLALGGSSCFVLTAAGRQLAAEQQALQEAGPFSTGPAAPVPRWDGERRQLLWGDCLVKRFRVPAACQELILASLEEQGWPGRIDDPLPCRRDVHPRDRLREAIKALNRNQIRRLLCFRGDGTGQGILWGPAAGGKAPPEFPHASP